MVSKVAFLVDTPLQLYNSISCAFNNQWETKTDIYLLPQFKDSDRVIGILKKANVFNKIAVLPLDERFKIVKLNLLYAVIFPNKYVKSKMGIDMRKQKYDKIFVAQPTRLFDTLIAASGCKDVCGLEDGMGSYCRRIYDELATKKYKMIRSVFRKSYTVGSLYLHAPQYYIVNEIPKVCKIDSDFSEEQKKLINDIFGVYSFDEYNKYKLIYSNQPIMDFPSEHVSTEKEIIKCIGEVRGDNAIVRLHPREKEKEIYDSFHLDGNACLWEIYCKDFNEQHILVGYFSTTQFTPKLFYDKEPFVIFTYRIYQDTPKDRCEQFDKMVDELRDKYVNKDRVINAKNIDELRAVLKKFS